MEDVGTPDQINSRALGVGAGAGNPVETSPTLLAEAPGHMRRHPDVKTSHRVAVLDGITSPGAARSAAHQGPNTGARSNQPDG